MKFFNKILILSLAIVLLTYVQVGALANRAGTNAASELLIPVGAKYIAMGGASSSATGLEALYWNPAGLARSTYNAAAMFSHMTYIADINVSYVALGFKFAGIGAFGLSFKSLGFGDIAITTVDAPDGTGALFSPQYLTAGLTYSRGLTDRVAVGATVKLISETIDRVSASGVAFDFGVQYSGLADIQGLNIGVSIKHVGSGLQFDGNGLVINASPDDVNRPATPYKIVAASDELPTTMELGMSYLYNINENMKFNVESMFVNHNYQDDGAHFGGELAFNNMFFLRGGYGYALDAGEDVTGANTHIFGMTLGAGFQYNLGGFDFLLDYAYRQVEYFDANNVFTLQLGF